MSSRIEPLVTLRRRPLVRTAPSDRYFDYCLQPYDPRCSPAGKLRGENLLWHSLETVGAPAALYDALRAVQAAAGRDMTVFGVKHSAGRLWWELYFYDADKREGAIRAADFQAIVRPWFTIGAALRETAPYFMFSVDVLPDSTVSGSVDGLSYYLPYHRVQGGRSFKQIGDDVEFENVYRFYHPKREIEELLHDIRMSVFVDFARVPLSRVLLPELYACRRICVAKKRRTDGIYYSGIDVDQLLWFFRRFQYPEPIIDFVTRERGQMDHLRFDVGIDYEMDPKGDLVVKKTSYYSTI